MTRLRQPIHGVLARNQAEAATSLSRSGRALNWLKAKKQVVNSCYLPHQPVGGRLQAQSLADQLSLEFKWLNGERKC